MRRCFCLKFRNFGTTSATTRFMPKILVKIAWHKPNDMLTSSATLTVIRRLFKIIFFTASMFSSVVDVLGLFLVTRHCHRHCHLLKPVIAQLNLYPAYSRLAKRHVGLLDSFYWILRGLSFFVNQYFLFPSSFGAFMDL